MGVVLGDGVVLDAPTTASSDVLDNLSVLPWDVDKMAYAIGPTTFSLMTMTAFGKSLGAAANAETARAILQVQPNLNRRLLGKKLGADLGSTGDQPLEMELDLGRYIIDLVIVCNANMTPGAAEGTLYTEAGKSGIGIFSTSQTYEALDNPHKYIKPALNAALESETLDSDQLYLSLSVGNAVDATADFYVFGQTVS